VEGEGVVNVWPQNAKTQKRSLLLLLTYMTVEEPRTGVVGNETDRHGLVYSCPKIRSGDSVRSHME